MMGKNPFEAGLNKARRDASYKAVQEDRAVKPKEQTMKEIMDDLAKETVSEKSSTLKPEWFETPPPKEEKLETVLEAANAKIQSADLKKVSGYEQAARGVLDYVDLRGLPADMDPKRFGETGKQILAERMSRDLRPVLKEIVENAKHGLPSTDALKKVLDYVMRSLRTK